MKMLVASRVVFHLPDSKGGVGLIPAALSSDLHLFRPATPCGPLPAPRRGGRVPGGGVTRDGSGAARGGGPLKAPKKSFGSGPHDSAETIAVTLADWISERRSNVSSSTAAKAASAVQDLAHPSKRRRLFRAPLSLQTTVAGLKPRRRIEIWSILAGILTDHRRSLHAEIWNELSFAKPARGAVNY